MMAAIFDTIFEYVYVGRTYNAEKTYFADQETCKKKKKKKKKKKTKMHNTL